MTWTHRSRTSLWGRLRIFQFPPAWGYAFCVVLEKGFSFITIPLAARYLNAGEYGRLELAVSAVEFATILFLLGLSDTFARFASQARDEEERRRCLADLLGVAIVMALGAGMVVQLVAGEVAAALGAAAIATGLRWALAAAAVAGVLDLGLMWLRFAGNVGAYVLFVGVRSCLQLVMVVAFLHAGLGADGMLIANAVVLLVMTVLLAAALVRRHGLSLSRAGLARMTSYGLPLVAGALAMFVLGSCSRWFLAGVVADADIAFLALATKLAAVTTVLVQPFMMWWKPRRLAAVEHGVATGTAVREWQLGFAILLVSALSVILAAPVFVSHMLPADYAGVARHLPWTVLIVLLNELSTLCSLGAYARRTGISVMSINGAAAGVALVLLVFLVAPFGVGGALAAMIAGHAVRLALFVATTRREIGFRFPAARALSALALSAAAAAAVPQSFTPIGHVAWSVASIAVVAATLTLMGFLPLLRMRSPTA